MHGPGTGPAAGVDYSRVPVPLPSRIGRYEVLEGLGEGGMGTVYLCQDPTIGRRVAVKVLRGHLDDPDQHRRFMQEARAAGALTHPNVVTIHDFGEFDGAPYLVMEYVRGSNLAAVIKRREAVPIATKLRWIEELCSGLAYAHASRVIHRDIKPQNVMVDERSTLKVLDFGIARVTETGATKMSMVVGTPGYMSPEQIDGRSIDRRSDIFSVGAVAYALLSYAEAFAGDTIATVMLRVLTVDPPALADICEGMPIAVSDAVARALRKDPADRFQDAGDMALALQAARRDLGPVEPKTVPAGGRQSERRTPASRVTPADLARRRAEQIDRHLRVAEQALGRGHVEATEQACAAVLMLDPQNDRALKLLAASAELAGDPDGESPTERMRALDPGAATPPPVPAPLPPPPAGRPLPPSMVARPEAVSEPSRRWPMAAGAVVLAALIAIAVGTRWRQTPGETSGAPTTPGDATAVDPQVVQPSASEALMKDAAGFEAAGRASDAMAAYQQVLSADPAHAGARAALARLRAEQSPRPPQPPPDVVAQGPSPEDRVRADGLVRRAAAAFEAGDYDAAFADAQRALDAVPRHAAAAALQSRILRAREAEATMKRRPQDR